MEITPGRAPFAEDEDYKPLRKPKSASTTPTHETAYMNASSGGIGDFNGQPNYGRTVSPSNLSPFAKEFVPRFGGNNTAQERLLQQQKQQQQYVQQNYHQYHHRPSGYRAAEPRATNGYPYNQQQQQQQQQHQRKQPQSGYTDYSNQVGSLCTSVQDRLRIGNNSGSTPSNNQNTSNAYNMQHQHQYQHQHHQGRQNRSHQQQNRYSHPSTSRSAQSNNADRHLSNGAGSGSNGGGNGSGNDVEVVALNYLRTVIHCLNENPGQFDTIATRFLTIFDGMENNQYVLSNAMEDIFQESIQNPNFRYMGAKLYNLLHMLNLKKDSLFHTLLKCKLDYHQTEVLQYMQTNQQQKVRETALFLAELYMQLRGDDSRIHLIAENIVFSLKQLLSKESNENIRCICLTLKLAGYDLTADCPKDVHEIIAQLDAINVKSPGKYPLAANVISLQKNNWGRKITSSISEVELPKPPEPLRISDEPIFYGPDGRELTTEETDFLTGGASGVDNLTDDEAADLDVDFDPEMDEETEKAYKEFCKLSSTT